jgi:hypothetical protein
VLHRRLLEVFAQKISRMRKLAAVKPRDPIRFLERSWFVPGHVSVSHHIYYHSAARLDRMSAGPIAKAGKLIRGEAARGVKCLCPAAGKFQLNVHLRGTV